MASNNSGDNKQTLELLLKCALCNIDLHKNNQPKSLACLHTFCTPCLTNQQQRFIQDNNIFKCPVCHTSVDRSSQESAIIDNLKLDVIIEKLLHVRHLQQSERHCEMCPEEGVVSTHWCLDCSKFLCDSCLVHHEKYKPKDKVFDVSQGVELDKVSEFISPTKCSQHEKRLKMYCSQCETCLCSVCSFEHLSNEDTNCKLVSIEAVVPDIKSQGQKLLQETSSHLIKQKQHIEGMELKIRDLNRYFSEKSAEIWEHVEETISRLKQNARTFIAGIEAEINSEIEELQKLIQLRQDHIKQMEIIDQNFSQLFKSFSNVDMLINYPRIKSKCENLLLKPTNNICSTLHGLNTVYNSWYSITHEMSKNIPLGRWWRNITSADVSSLDKSSDLKEEVNMTLPFLLPPVPCLEYPKSEELSIDLSDVTYIFVTNENHVLLGSGQPLLIHAYNEKNECLDKRRYTDIKTCTELCHFSLGKIFFVNGTSIWIGSIIKRSGNECSFSYSEIIIKPPVKCLSICNCFGKVLLCDYFRRVYLFNDELTNFKTLVDIQKPESSFHKIRCGPFEDTFLLFDDQDKKLFCYNLSNCKCLFSFKVGNVKGLCTDNYGNIYVAEQDVVYVLSPYSLEKHYIFTIKPQGHNYCIFVKDDVFYFASDNSGKWMLEKFRLYYHQRSSPIDEK